jgi:hypothetical protein
MELVPSYLHGEEDTWNPLRGTGLYELRDEVDFQDSWTAFSHRFAIGFRTPLHPSSDTRMISFLMVVPSAFTSQESTTHYCTDASAMYI